jgi:putative hydrolase of the HAD superfamily
MLNGVRGVVFDLEDTLFDKSDWIIPAIEYAAEQFGLDLTRTAELLQEYSQRPTGLDANVYNHVLLGCGQFDTAMNVRALCAWANQYHPARGSLQLYPGTLTALECMSAKYKLAIVAEGQVETQKLKISALGIEPVIPVIAYSDEIDGIRSRRPDPRGVLLAIQKLNLPPSEVLWVADNPARDFLRLRERGVLTARVLTGECSRQDPPSQAHAADYNISSVARLPALLEELKGAEPSLPTAGRQDPPPLTLLTQDRRF